MSIEAGVGVSTYKIGMTFNIDEHVVLSNEARGSETLYKTEGLWFFVESNSLEIRQITVVAPNSAKVNGNIGVGDRIELVFEILGKCKNDFGEYEPVNHPGICFESQRNSNSKSAKIVSISVFEPYKFHGTLPDNIMRNLDGKRRLP